MMWEYQSTTANDSSCARGTSCHKQHILKFYRLARFVRPKCFHADLPCHIFLRTYQDFASASQDLSRFFPNQGTFFCLANKIHHFSLVIRKNVKKSGQRNRASTWSPVLFICRSLLQRLLQCLCMCRWRQHKWHYPGTKPEWIMVCLEKKTPNIQLNDRADVSWCFLQPMIWYIKFVEKKRRPWVWVVYIPFWADSLGRIVMTTGLVPQRHIGRSAKSCNFWKAIPYRIGVHPGICCFQIQPHSEIDRKLSYSLLRMCIQKQHLDGLLSYVLSYQCVLSSCTIEHAFHSRRRELVRQACCTWQQKTQ